MRVIGTAGHVDHGKSKLVLALSGTDPDRLKEEQEREMTIDLGFAWVTLPEGEEVGIVDVPGHRDFIENMLAGVGSIDAALFVVAADEGVMPQTREHLAILDLLEIPSLVVALTKMDLVNDSQWMDLVREEVRELLQLTRYREAPLVAVSSRTGTGLEQLRTALEEALKGTSLKRDLSRPRLGVDRAFTISGFGTVVTGTLIDGVLQVGQEVEVLPSGIAGRIRGLQTHKTKIERAIPGSRVAANLSGIDVKALRRGDVVVHPDTYTPTKMIDVHFRVLPGSVIPIEHDQEVKLFLGAAQRTARIRLLGVDQLAAGQHGWLQLVLEEPVVAERRDRFILRRPSPGATLGGGQVADPHPRRRHRLRDQEVLERLGALVAGSPAEVFAANLKAMGPAPLGEIAKRAGLEQDLAIQAVEHLHESGVLINLSDERLSLESEPLVLHRETWSQLKESMQTLLQEYHRQAPLRLGMSKEELKSRLRMTSRPFSSVLQAAVREGWVEESGPNVRHIDHQVTLSPAQQANVDRLMMAFEEQRFSPPSVKDSLEIVDESLLAYLIESGRLRQVSADVLFTERSYQEMKQEVEKILQREGTITVAQVRDHFQTSRRYSLALLEHLDQIGFTEREGDFRRLAKNSS